MAFDYTYDSGCQLDDSIVQLLDEIDGCAHTRLNPFNSLGEIHKNLTVQVVNKIPDRQKTITITLGKLKEKLRAINERNAEIEKIRKEEEKTIKENEDWSLEGFMSNKIGTKDIEDAINRHIGESDSTLIEYVVKISRTGYYTRDRNNNGLIVLMYTRDAKSIASTYVHEMMHAYYDDNCGGLMNDVEYVEEPLAELGMLMFMEAFHQQRPEYSELFNESYFGVKEKQNCVGIMHYGFGAILYDCYHKVDWEVMMKNRHTIRENALGGAKQHYENIKNHLCCSWPTDDECHNVASDIFALLVTCNYGRRLSKPTIKPMIPHLVFLHKGLSYCSDVSKVKIGERILPISQYETRTENSKVEVNLCCYADFDLNLYVISKINSNNTVEVNCYCREISKITKLIFDGNLISVNIPYCCKSIYVGRHAMLKTIVVDKRNDYYKYDSSNKILTDKFSDTLVLGMNDSKIPNEIERIGDGAFCGCEMPETLVIPDNITYIGKNAYSQCALIKYMSPL